MFVDNNGTYGLKWINKVYLINTDAIIEMKCVKCQAYVNVDFRLIVDIFYMRTLGIPLYLLKTCSFEDKKKYIFLWTLSFLNSIK